MVPLDEADAKEQDVPAAERDSLLLRARDEVGGGHRVRRHRVVREPPAVCVRVELDHVEQHAADADAVLSPV